MNGGGQEREHTFRTRAGYSIRLDESGKTCSVILDGQPEVISLNGVRTINQPVLNVVFIGHRFDSSVVAGDPALVSNRGRRLHVPYRLLPDREIKYVTFSSSSGSDQFPVSFRFFPGVQNFMQETRGNGGRFIIVDGTVPRIDLIRLKVKFPSQQVLIIRTESPEPEEEVSDAAAVRASDLARSGRAGELAGDPVFLARIHLRNLDLDAVRLILKTHDLGTEEIQFIRTFLQIMIRNERKDRDLMAAKKELENLDELFRLSSILAADKKELFDAELDRGIRPPVAKNLVPLVSRMRGRARNKDEEILFWEWEYRLAKVAEGGR